MAASQEDIFKKYPSLKKFDDPDYEEWNDGREVELLKFIYSHPSIEEMRGNPVKILNAMDDFAREQDFLISIGPHKAGVLGEFIAAEKPRVAAEFGGYVGYSAIWFAEQMRKAAGADASQLRVWSLEFDPLFAAISMSFIELAGLSDIAKVIVGKADESLTRLTKEDKVDHIDFLFLDHDESLYMQGLKAVEALGLLKPGMVIAADNAVRPGAPDYVKYVRAHPKLDSKGVRGLIVPGDREDEIEISKVK